jgi:hypothetical protein
MKKTLLSIVGGTLISSAIFAQTQPANADFENWETLNGPISNTYQEPNSWNSSNECTAIVNQFSVTKSSDMHSGSFSARLETKSTSFQGVIANGVVTTAQMVCLAQGGGQQGGSTYTDQIPDSVVGWYKYAPTAADSGYAQIMFLANNNTDTLSFTRLNFHAAASWTRFSAAITPYTGAQATEKLSLFFNSSWGDGSQGQAIVGSVLFIDDVEFIFPFDIGVGDELGSQQWSVYPNPVEDILRVKVVGGTDAKIELFDVTGKRVKTAPLNEDEQTVDLSSLVAGVYLYQITSVDNAILRTGKLLVNP